MRRLSILGLLAGAFVVVMAGLQLPASATSAGPAALAAPAPSALACQGWQVVPSPGPGSSSALAAVAATSSTDAWAVGSWLNPASATTVALIEHWDGSAWSTVPSPAVPGAPSLVSLAGVAALSPTNAWAVGSTVTDSVSQPLIEHWDGTSWTIIPSAGERPGLNALTAVAARTATDIWAVGYRQQVSPHRLRTLIEHWNGTTWHVVRSPNAGKTGSRLFGVAVVSAARAWAVGTESNSDGSTLAERWNGSSWSVVPTRNRGHRSRSLQAVAAHSARRVFAVGSDASRTGIRTHILAERWRGSRWSVTPAPNPGRHYNALQGVAVRSATRVWAVGTTQPGIERSSATLAERWNGTRWRVVSTPSPGSGNDGLSGIAEIPHRGGFWAVGNEGDSTLTEFHC